MEINLSFLSETLSPVSEGSSAQPAVAVVSLRDFWETQPIQCHLSLSFLGFGEVVAYCFTVYAIWSDSLIRQGGYILWYCLCLWPLFLAMVYTASFLGRFSNCCKIKSSQGFFSWCCYFLCLFYGPSPLHLQIPNDSDISGFAFLLRKCEEVTACASLALFRRLDGILQLLFWGA